MADRFLVVQFQLAVSKTCVYRDVWSQPESVGLLTEGLRFYESDRTALHRPLREHIGPLAANIATWLHRADAWTEDVQSDV